MTAREVIEYLSGFSPDDNMGVIALDLRTRQAYKIGGYQLITDAGFPVLLFELGTAEPLDDIVEEAKADENT